MRLAEVVHGVPFEQVDGGNIIQFFDMKGRLYTGMKVTGAQCDGVLFLKGHSPNDRATIFWDRDNMHLWDHDMLLEFPDATLTPHEFAFPGTMPATGNLAIRHDGTTVFLSKTNDSVKYVDVTNG